MSSEKNVKEMAQILGKRPELAPLLLQILEDPTRAADSLALMISAEADTEKKKKLLGVKHAVERFALQSRNVNEGICHRPGHVVAADKCETCETQDDKDPTK